MIKISEFQLKDVININDGKRLGNVGDLDINLSTGKIDAIIILKSGKFLGMFGREDEVIIPWRNIIKIGSDVILVRHYDMNEQNNANESQHP
jgi:YlmC/YmxH family sporulation protein